MFNRISVMLMVVIFMNSIGFAGKTRTFDYVIMSGPTAATIFPDQSARFPIQMKAGWHGACCMQIWTLPSNTELEYVNGTCPSLYSEVLRLPDNVTCNLNLVVKGLKAGVVYSNHVTYYYDGADRGKNWRRTFQLAPFTVKVIPRPLSIDGIPDQSATANLPFSFKLHGYIAHYDENVTAGAKPNIGMSVVNGSPTFSELGLSYDPQSLTLSGVPNQTGVFEYQLTASNSYSSAAPKIFRINIAENPKDKPHFRTNRLLPAAIPSKSFHFNLMQLLEPQEGFNVTNQVTFKIDEQKTNASILDWLSIKNSTELVGTPEGLAGKTVTAFIYAESNTGGQSETVDIKLPIAYDESKKPQIQKGISVSSHAGGQIYFDMKSKINDPSSGDKLKVIIDSTTPEAGNWLKVSKNEPTILEGTVPLDATGQLYSINLHANNSEGGDSDQETIQLKVETDPARKPRFKAANPVLHELHPGQPYLYDFKYYNDVFPEYKDAPYTITFAEGYEHPSWLKLENNQLIAESVPDSVIEDFEIAVKIHNKPGGDSEDILLVLYVIA